MFFVLLSAAFVLGVSCFRVKKIQPVPSKSEHFFSSQNRSLWVSKYPEFFMLTAHSTLEDFQFSNRSKAYVHCTYSGSINFLFKFLVETKRGLQKLFREQRETGEGPAHHPHGGHHGKY
jgi:hypothetical protein